MKNVTILMYKMDNNIEYRSITNLVNLLQKNYNINIIYKKDKSFLKYLKIIRKTKGIVVTPNLFISFLLGLIGNSKNKIYYDINYKDKLYLKRLKRCTKKIDCIVTYSKELCHLYKEELLVESKYINDVVKTQYKQSSLEGNNILAICNSKKELEELIKTFSDLNIEEIKLNIICNFKTDKTDFKNVKLYSNLNEEEQNKLYVNSSILLDVNKINNRLEILTAFSFGLPIIAYESLELKELVSNNWDGYLVKDKEAMIRKIIFLFNSEYRRIIMGNNAIKKIDKMSNNLIRKSWIKVIERGSD